jgi:hypothetical protein
MTDKTTQAASLDTRASEPRSKQANEPTNLSYRYGTIGIEAVAAAVRYADVRKDPTDMSAAPRIDLRFVESSI